MGAVITSPDNPKLRFVTGCSSHGVSARRKACSSARARISSQAADDAGIEPVELLRAGEDVEPELLAKVSTMGAPAASDGHLPAALPRGVEPASLALWHVADPGNLGTSCARPTRSGA